MTFNPNQHESKTTIKKTKVAKTAVVKSHLLKPIKPITHGRGKKKH